MKKNLILALAVVAAVASCQKDMEPVSIQQATDNAISFSAYTGTAVTRGKIDTLATGDSLFIGVFAFYQGTDNFNTHQLATPNFMYNQQVCVKTGAYSPIKYWPNNSGDKLSFFAYAPYDSDKSWEDMGISTDVNGKKATVTFPINQEVEDQVDYLWAKPTFNKEKPVTTEKIAFDFKHITSQVSLYVGVETDSTHQKPAYWTDSTTIIYVNSVELKGLNEFITFKYDIFGTTTDTIFTGEQDIILTRENFFDEAEKIDTTTWKDKSKSAKWLAKGTGSGITAADSIYKQLTDSASFMFLAPQIFNDAANDFVFTYTVKTTDRKNAANNSEIKNVIKADLYDILSSNHKFEAGKAYKIYCLIGMNSVKFKVTAEEWADATYHQVDVPANN